ncbi:MurR/RpiR family transcriptional regulator [Rheinheimera baltica]|uniref:MurR/RpiR family transcriptional regulator n=2 Tax=Rheinheimera baltica TaxID=67576 RepID=A0ABT9HY35_9GAMM|nr:MurR/RpiR family transcriptional regulator [Rheinheimera baltica]MDP5136039.1 MurR/RpiR family transcriptional regulator [Rheinheimera baltica]MDP5142063.1 MurR/RpiR family transcriptional regulator [Rheinheimera baltica]MDP5150564.1 MurR/RpiR family transcriptional regulator [Rheinheimera baltica]
MVCLLKIRGMLQQMSVIERKLADFILDNANLLRDYSSQQLADAVGTSQSSVVKFCQKLGYKGYPDLKLAVNEAVITASTLQRDSAEPRQVQNNLTAMVEQLQFSLQSHLRGILEINAEKTLLEVADMLAKADNVLLAGYGKSGIVAHDMQFRLLQLGKLALLHSDPAIALQMASMLSPQSIVLLVSESGQNADLLKLARYAKQRQIPVISLTSFKTNALSVAADQALFALSGDENVRINPILVQLAQQHLCHILYLLLCQQQNNDHQLEENSKLLNILAQP